MTLLGATVIRKAVETLEAEPRILLHNISWKFYEAFLAERGERPGIRLVYDQGNLEIMTVSREHELFSRLLGYLIIQMAMELDWALGSGGACTFRRKDIKRGLEPDSCYWIQNAARIKGKRKLDLSRDPPPDLAIEITITTSFLDRLAICEALGIPEIWRFDGESLQVYALNANGNYTQRKRSRAFPFLQPAQLVPFLQLGLEDNDTRAVKEFQAWFRKDVLPTIKKNGPR